jgi:endonuclease YncB( thermonuclease family)
VTLALFIAAAVMLMLGQDRRGHSPEPSTSGLVALYNPSPANVRRVPQKSARPAPDRAVRSASRAMPVCGGGKRINCVVDGDTFWLDGEKIRIEDIDAPEVKGKCRHERQLAAKATKRLSVLLSRQAIRIERNGRDRFGRTLVQVSTGRGEVGKAMIRDGLAREYAGGRRSWCDS